MNSKIFQKNWSFLIQNVEWPIKDIRTKIEHFLTNRVKLMNLYPDIKRVIRSGPVRFFCSRCSNRTSWQFRFRIPILFPQFCSNFSTFPAFYPHYRRRSRDFSRFWKPSLPFRLLQFFSFLLLVCFDNNENWLRMIERLFRMIWKRPDLHTIHMFSWLFKNFHECGTIFSTFMFMYILNFV